MPRHRRSFIPALIPLALLVFACGQTSNVTQVQGPAATATPLPTVTPIPKPSASVARITNAVYFPDSKSGGSTAPCANGDPLINGDCGVTVTATCASGDVVVSGGYLLSDPLAFVTSSYPSSASAWTITAHDEGQDGGSHPVTVTAYAGCLHANVPTGVVPVVLVPGIPADGAFHPATVDCPAAGVVTGGGFRGTNSMQETMPAANGWAVTLGVQVGSSAKPGLYVLCATKHLAAAGHPTVNKNQVTGSGVTVTASCPAGTLLVGGGGQTASYGNLTHEAPNATMTQWDLDVSPLGVVGGPPTTYTATDAAVCVTVS